MLLLILVLAGAAPAPQASCADAPTWVESFAPNLADSARLYRGTFSADGRTLYYFRKITPGQEDYRIYVSRLQNGRWTDGERLDLGGDFSDLYPSVSPDGKRLVFSSYRPAPGDTSSHPNAYLWYAERRGRGWGPPVFIAAASRFGNYHPGPVVLADYGIRFNRLSADYRVRTAMRTRWNGRTYEAAVEAAAEDPATRWRDWRPEAYHVWGGLMAPTGEFVLLSISARDPATRRARPADLWVSLRSGDGWSEPVPAGGGVKGANFVEFHPNGCEIIYVRGYTEFKRVGIEAVLAPARRSEGRLPATPLRGVEGFYRGAYVRGASAQVVEAEITRRGDTLLASVTTPEWPLFPPQTRPLQREPDGHLRLATPYGPALLAWDSLYGTLVGTVGSGTPPTSLHLTRGLPAPSTEPVREPVTVTSTGVTLAGTLVRPRDGPVRAAMVVVPGRGCSGRTGGVLLLEALARYGIAGVAFDKRGVGESGGSCRYGTIEDFTGDVLAQLALLRQRLGSDSVRVGLYGVSAGGWTIVRAAARAPQPVDFLITNVGPAVSVAQQQRDNTMYITRRLGFSPGQQARALRYIDLMFASGNQAARFEEMQQIVAWAKEVGFADQFFEDSDIPGSVAAVDSLWVTLNGYDPANDLGRLRLPLLAFFGEEDEVVPPRENVAALRRIAERNPGLRARIVVVPGAGHGLVLPAGMTDLGRNDRAFRFPRTAPQLLEGIVEFLWGLTS